MAKVFVEQLLASHGSAKFIYIYTRRYNPLHGLNSSHCWGLLAFNQGLIGLRPILVWPSAMNTWNQPWIKSQPLSKSQPLLKIGFSTSVTQGAAAAGQARILIGLYEQRHSLGNIEYRYYCQKRARMLIVGKSLRNLRCTCREKCLVFLKCF